MAKTTPGPPKRRSLSPLKRHQLVRRKTPLGVRMLRRRLPQIAGKKSPQDTPKRVTRILTQNSLSTRRSTLRRDHYLKSSPFSSRSRREPGSHLPSNNSVPLSNRTCASLDKPLRRCSPAAYQAPRWLFKNFQAFSNCDATEPGVVEPGDFLLTILPSGVSRSRGKSASVGCTAASISADTSSREIPASSHRRTSCPTARCASRKGTPLAAR